MDEQQQRLQVDLGGLQDAITIDPDKLSSAISLPTMTGDADVPETVPSEEGPLDTAPLARPEPAPQPERPDLPKSSWGQAIYDWMFAPGGEDDDELQARIDEEIAQLSMRDLLRAQEALFNGAPLPEDIAAQVPSFMHRQKLWEYQDSKPGTIASGAIFAADLVQAAAVGSATGIKNIAMATYSGLDWLDNSLEIDVLPDTDSDAYRNFEDNVSNNLDRWMPDGIMPSIVGAVTQTLTGMYVAGGLGKAVCSVSPSASALHSAVEGALGTTKANYLWTVTKSALSSATAFDPKKDGNLFNALENIPGLKDSYLTFLATDPDDGKLEAWIKNFTASIVTDVSVDLLVKGLKRMASAVRRTNDEAVTRAIVPYGEGPIPGGPPRYTDGVPPKAAAGRAEALPSKAGVGREEGLVPTGPVVDNGPIPPEGSLLENDGIIDVRYDTSGPDAAGHFADTHGLPAPGLQGPQPSKGPIEPYSPTNGNSGVPTPPQLPGKADRDYLGQAYLISQEEADDIAQDIMEGLKGVDTTFEAPYVPKNPGRIEPPYEPTNPGRRAVLVDDVPTVQDTADNALPPPPDAPTPPPPHDAPPAAPEAPSTPPKGKGKGKAKASSTDAPQGPQQAAQTADAPKVSSPEAPKSTSGNAGFAKGQEPSVKNVIDECFQLLDSEAGSMDYRFTPTHDVINTSTIGHEMMKDKGFENFISGLGNDVDTNAFGRASKEFTPLTNADLKERVRDALGDITGEYQKLDWLSKASEQLASGIVRAKALYVGHVKELYGIMKKLDRQDIDAATKKMIIDGELTNAILNTAKALSFFDTLSTNTGRALQAHKIGLDDILTESTQSNIYQNMLKNIGKMSSSTKMMVARDMAMAGTARNSAKMLKALAQPTYRKALDAFTANRINFMLSGLKTHLANFTSNAFNQGILMPLDNMLAGWGGFKGGFFSINDREVFNRGRYAWHGITHSLKEAWHLGKVAMDLGESVIDVDSGVIERNMRAISSAYLGLDADSWFGKLIDGYGRATGFVTRALVGSDEFFKQTAYRGALYADLMTQGMDAASRRGLKGKAAQEFAQKYLESNWSRHFKDVLDTAGNVIKGGAGATKEYLDIARVATFTEKLAKGSIYEGLSNLANRNLLARHIMPFVRTPSNIMDNAMTRMPGIGLMFSKRAQEALKAGGRARDQIIARQTMGAMFCAMGGYACWAGLLTGGAPAHKATRDALYATGWRPYSIKAGDTYISYERIEPLRNVLGAIADATQIFNSETAGIDLSTISGSEGMGPMEIGMTVVNAVSQNFINQSYMKGLADVMDALVNDGMGYSVEKALKDFTLSSTLPNISNTVRQAIDPEFKEVRTWMDAYRNKIPGLSDSLPARYSWITGEPSLYMGGHFSSVLPVTGSWKPKDSTLEALEQVATLLPSLSPNIMGHPLDGQQMSDYCRLHGTVKIKGKTMLQAIEAVVDKSKGSDRYDLADAVAKTVREYRNLAKQELYKLYPDLSVSKRKQQRQGRLSLTTPTTPSEGSGASVARIADQLSSF